MAAGKVKGITIEIGGDTNKLDKSLSGVNRSSKALQTELQKVNQLLKLDPKNTELLAQKQAILKESIGKTKEKLDLLKEAEAKAQVQFANGKGSEKQYRELQREIIATEENLKRLEAAAKDSNISLEKIADATAKVGEKSEALGKKMLPLSGAIVGVGVASGKMASDFNDAMAKVNTIADTTQVPLDDLSRAILDLSDETGIAANDIADNVYNAISAGQKTGDAVNFVREATTLAKAGFADSASSLDILTTIMNAYGLEATEVTNVSDMLIQTQNLGKTTVAELSGAMGKVIPTANANNVALDQLCAGYSILTAKGVATAESTTYMNAMLNELGKGGTKVDTILREKTGKSFSELSAEGVSLGDVLQIIDDKAIESGKSFSDLWSSSEGAKAGITLLGDGADEFNSRLAEMNESTGATQTAFEKLDTDSNQAKIALNQLKNSTVDFGTTLLNTLRPTIEKIVAKIKEFTQWFKNLSDSQKENIIKIGMLVAAIAPALIVFGKVAKGISAAILVVGKIKAAIVAAKGAFAAFNVVLAANPIGLIVAAIAALIAVFVLAYNKCEWFRNMVNDAFAQIKAAIAKAVEQIKPIIQQIGEAFTKLMNSLKPVIQFFMTYVLSIVQGIISALAPIVAAVKNAIDFITNIINAVMALFKGDFDGFGQYLMAALQNMVDFIMNIVQAVINYIVTFFAGFGVDIKQIFTNIWQGIVAIFAGVGQWFTDRFTEAYTGITNAFAAVGQWFADIWQGITSIFSAVGQWFTDRFTEAYTGITNAFAAVGQWFADIWQGITSIFSAVGQWFTDRFTEAYTGIVNIFSPIVAWFAPLFESVKELVSLLGQWIALKFQEAYNNIVLFFTPIGQWFAARWQDIQTALSAVATWFSTMFQNAYTNVTNAFKAIGQWFAARWQDIQNALAPVANWFSTMFQNAYRNVTTAFAAIGQWFAARWQDIQNALAPVANWFSTMFQNAYRNVTTAFAAIGQWFTDRYNDIVNAFKEIPNFFKGIFDDAWENIKGAFSGVIDFFTGIRDTIMGFFNGIADAIRGEIEDATESTKKGTGGSSRNSRATPEFARGGILRNGRGIVAEAGPELIEMVNGAAIITPLGNRATNTPITAMNGADSGLQQVFHFHSPKALDPYETARLARNATRGAVLKLQGV